MSFTRWIRTSCRYELPNPLCPFYPKLPSVLKVWDFPLHWDLVIIVNFLIPPLPKAPTGKSPLLRPPGNRLRNPLFPRFHSNYSLKFKEKNLRIELEGTRCNHTSLESLHSLSTCLKSSTWSLHWLQWPLRDKPHLDLVKFVRILSCSNSHINTLTHSWAFNFQIEFRPLHSVACGFQPSHPKTMSFEKARVTRQIIIFGKIFLISF